MSGPSRHNISDIYGGLEAAGAVSRVENANDIAVAAQRLLADELAREEAIVRAVSALEAMGGALDKTVAALLPTASGDRTANGHLFQSQRLR